MIKKIYLVRHGQTDYNKKGIVQGSGIDADLNETGQAQAKAFFDIYKDVPFEKVYVSGLKRTYQSVEGFIQRGLPFDRLEELNEISWGTHEGVVIDPAGEAYYRDMISQWSQGNTSVAIEEGESPDEVSARLKIGMKHILSEQFETILICMHGRAMRVLLADLLGYPLRYMDMFEHTNLGLYQLTYTGSMFQVERYNDQSHFTR